MSEPMTNNKFTPWPMTEPAYTAQDLREAVNFQHEGFADTIADELKCPCKDCRDLAGQFARVRREAVAGAVEACARLERALQKGTIRYSRERGEPEISVAFAYETAFTIPEWNEVQAARAAIRSIADAADEAIERIKREARLEQLEDLTIIATVKGTKRLIEEIDARIAALSGKETEHD